MEKDIETLEALTNADPFFKEAADAKRVLDGLYTKMGAVAFDDVYDFERHRDQTFTYYDSKTTGPHGEKIGPCFQIRRDGCRSVSFHLSGTREERRDEVLRLIAEHREA